jgi:hypothetical protein
MSQQIINIGATPNDGLGDPVRTAFEKTNQNFTQLFANVANTISVTGNITGNYFFGNGAYLTGISGGNGGNASTGNVTFDNINIIGTGNLHLQPDANNSGAFLDVYLTSGPDIHIAGNGENVIVGSDDGANVTIGANGDVQIQASTGNSYTWTFGSDGAFTFPDGSFQSQAFQGNADTALGLANVGNVLVTIGDGITIDQQWTFGLDGNLTFPGNLNAVAASPAPNINGFDSVNVLRVSASGNINAANINAAGQIIGTYTPGSTTGTAILTQGANTQGGTGYFDFIKVVNQSGNATNPNKFLRMDQGGNLQIINSGYSQTLFNLTDAGALSVIGNVSANNINAAGNFSSTGAVIHIANSGANAISINGAGIVAGANVATILYDNSVFGWTVNQGWHPAANTTYNLGRTNRVWNNLYAANINTTTVTVSNSVSAAGNITGSNMSVAGQISFSDGSHANTFKWTLVETVNANLAAGFQIVSTVNSYNYYAANYNEVLFLSSSGGGKGATITIPVDAVIANSTWNINQQIGFRWPNLAASSVNVVAIGAGPYTTVSFTMYAR